MSRWYVGSELVVGGKLIGACLDFSLHEAEGFGEKRVAPPQVSDELVSQTRSCILVSPCTIVR